jgi:NAD+-dependent protein deacetylase sirtuin 5
MSEKKVGDHSGITQNEGDFFGVPYATKKSIPEQPSTTPQDYETFRTYLASSRRILCIIGAGLSASSGIPTYRGAGGLWRNFDATELATPDAFQKNPSMVWQFWEQRRFTALKAQPNPAHYALAALAGMAGKDVLTISQNIDGMFAP